MLMRSIFSFDLDEIGFETAQHSCLRVGPSLLTPVRHTGMSAKSGHKTWQRPKTGLGRTTVSQTCKANTNYARIPGKSGTLKWRSFAQKTMCWKPQCNQEKVMPTQHRMMLIQRLQAVQEPKCQVILSIMSADAETVNFGDDLEMLLSAGWQKSDITPLPLE